MDDVNRSKQEEVHGIIRDTVKKFFSPSVHILGMEEQPIKRGYNSVEIYRHKVVITDQGSTKEVCLITKKAALTERLVLSRLASQAAQVPQNFTADLVTDAPAFMCMIDIDHGTDYRILNVDKLMKQEHHILSHIHLTNRGLHKQLTWLPIADRSYVLKMLNTRWKPYWDKAMENEEFVETFSPYVPDVELAAANMAQDMEMVTNDEVSQTLIHTDLHPGNVLVQRNEELFYIDWEEAHYGSFYFDISHRLSHPGQVEKYRLILDSHGIDIPESNFTERYRIASRYTGLRYMAWTLEAWAQDRNNTEQLYRYLNMAVN